jgi:hypothetical protein
LLDLVLSFIEGVLATAAVAVEAGVASFFFVLEPAHAPKRSEKDSPASTIFFMY